ncbi:MAG: helix-turn-helix domain-containing protein, partial [Treponema sp.]|nr:helix-turn-helix domain-containing protein [Treponema sp.]
AGSHGGSRCRRMHVDAIRESARIGGPYIYQCALGLYFWTSALYKDGKFSGALRASGFTGAGAGQEETSASMCCGPIPAEEFRRRVAAFPRAGMEKIKSFAEMLLLCARSLSSGSEDFHKALRSRSVQQASISALLDELKAKNAEGGVLPAYPLEHEKKLIASVRRGDKNEAEKTLNELLAMLVFACSDNFRGIQLRALELAILLVHAGANSGGGAPVENTGCYLKHIQEARTVVELTAVLHKIVGFITAGIVSFQGVPHALAMRRAEIFIRENLTRKIRLNEIARIAGLSAPYFSTIFKEEMGENLSRYINRLRVEKAARMLLETDLSLSAISGACCFEDQSWFSKIFKSVTGLSPGKYRGQGGCLSTNA